MGFDINSLRGRIYSNASKATSQHGATTAASTSSVHQTGATNFTVSQYYQHYQSELLRLLKDQGFLSDQAKELSEVSKMPAGQLARIVIIAKAIQKHNQLFRGYVQTLKNIVSRGNNTQSAIKSYLDGFESVLKLDTQKIIEAPPPKEQPLPQADVSKGQKQAEVKQPVNDRHQFEKHLYQNLSQQLTNSQKQANVSGKQDLQLLMHSLQQLAKSQSIEPVKLGAKEIETLQNFIKLAQTSLKEFPQRFHIDLFSFAHLHEKGITLDTYLKLASEVSPVRLLNLLVVAQKNGQNTEAMINSLITMQQSGGDAKTVIQNLEQKFGLISPKEIQNQQQTIPVATKTVSIQQGQHAVLDFLAFDAGEGVVGSERSSFVLFPQNHEYSGQTLNLSFLPPGMYMVLAKAYNGQNQMISLWMKVIVEGKKKREAQKSFEEFQEKFQKVNNDSQKKQQQNQKGSEQQQNHNPQNGAQEESQLAPNQDRFLNTQFENQPANFKGPFLGEITLPFDYLNLEANDLHIVCPHTGIVMDRNEFYNGDFSHNAVTFRFLTNYLEPSNMMQRHELLHLRASNLFEDFDKSIRDFVSNPKSELTQWRKTMYHFFHDLAEMFPAGQKTFELAHKFFVRESETFAEGNYNRDFFENRSLEKKEDKFLAAFYAKSGYAMASAGEVSGALHGLSFASLMNLDDSNQKAVLGEYLEQLKKKFYQKESATHAENTYDIHMSHSIDQPLLANGYYKEQGEDFLKTINLALPESCQKSEAQAKNPYEKQNPEDPEGPHIDMDLS